jgi:KDO2-lipid IV(A) lauroyltransferase
VKKILELLSYLFVRGLFEALATLPHAARCAFFGFLFRMAFATVPRLRSTIDTNLKVAFPEKDAEWRNMIRRQNAGEMGRLLADTVRLSQLDESWVKTHVEIPVLESYRARISGESALGALIATGHLGSFELLGHAIGLYGLPLAAVARRFQSKRFDSWWTGMREARGNKIIDRKGAFKAIVASVQSGMSAAVLFDQNVTRNHAVFVDWFGVPAATTRSVALAALRTGAPIFVASIRYLGGGKYRVEAFECEYSDIASQQALDNDAKVVAITQRLADRYCEMIRGFPEGWFWLHRRWKTRPDSAEAKFYA